jgi:hypothetical protein
MSEYPAGGFVAGPCPLESNVDVPTANRVVRRLQAWGLVPAPRREEFVLPDGDVLAGPATAAQIRAGGWGDLLPPE